ncbi:helix-turn-helix domain-containing protein [Paenibacillus sp. FSL R10-2736]|uniref:helix-turn-helix domain-containing protein n=1 Tax=Paenibacillus sp. FSL R10-2736 TaxID=2954692 RepID=UPI0030FC26F2
MDIQVEFGKRVKELRARSGMSQDALSFRSGLDRTYISGVERGKRNVTLDSMQRIAKALNVSLRYIFSDERFSAGATYLKKDFTIPFLKRFKYQLDPEKKVLAFQVTGLLTGPDVDYMCTKLMGICSAYGKDELNIIVDHRDMMASDGEPVVYSPEVSDRAVVFQQELTKYSKQVAVLCNSQFMQEQMDHVTRISGIHDKTKPLFGSDKDMVGTAFQMFDINGNGLIKSIV